MPRKLHSSLKNLASAVYGRSIFGALLAVVFLGLVIPAIIGSYLLVGIREETAAQTALNESLQRYADILALGMQESLWIMNPETARALVESVMRDQAVLRVMVLDQSDATFINVPSSGQLAGNGSIGNRAPGNRAPGNRASGNREVGNRYQARRNIIVRGERIGQLLIEMGDAKSNQELREKQLSYVFVLAAQLLISLFAIILFLNTRLLQPLRRLMLFSDSLSHGEFDRELALPNKDELGRLGKQLDQMRVAVKHLFEDVRHREERFRTIVTQVPGAVFRYRTDGEIEFISDTIEEICGYPAAHLIHGGSAAWLARVVPADVAHYQTNMRSGIAEERQYQVEYRILHRNGDERWVSESGHPLRIGTSTVLLVDGIITDVTERKHNEMRIANLLVEQGAILENVMFGVMFVRQRRIISANRRCEELFGYDSGQMAGQSTEILFPDTHEYELAGARQYLHIARSRDFSEERQYRRKDGSLLWCMVSGCALDPAQPNNGSIWVYADISERKLAEERLRLSAKVLEHIADGVIVTDVAGKVVAVNPAFTLITGYAESEAVGATPAILRSGREDKSFYRKLWADLAQNGFWSGEIWNKRKNGEFYLEWLTISAVRDMDGDCTHYVGVFRDITQAKESQKKLDHLAHHDPLTGLPNRTLFNDRLAHAMQRSAREHQQLALLFIDLDRFKNVNDSLGHHIGDELLKQVAMALTDKVRDGDTLARLGGDEFILLLENVDGQYGATIVAEKLMSVFESPFVIVGHELFVTCSVGISLFPADGMDLNMLIRNADVAMYQSKAHGRNAYRFYSAEMMGEGIERLRLESMLRRSIEKKEIFLNYQPQIEIESGRLVGVEALVRWQHPELGLVPPVKFIPLAEDTGYINQLGKWVLFESCRQMIRWQEEGLYVGKMAVNLSVKQFERGSIVSMVAEILAETGLEAHRLQLEVTESLIMNTGDAFVFINDLHAIGVGLAIDDFGTGYSSLAYLKQLPVQTLKIDRSFIKDISTDVNDEAIATAIIQLGKSLNLSVVAEGVETREQVEFLLRQGCNLAQGYYFSRPVLPQDLLERWLVD
jgi:diguanylate cyclase (GGDEF)-like protein/PAS domain S-box-containing protein